MTTPQAAQPAPVPDAAELPVPVKDLPAALNGAVTASNITADAIFRVVAAATPTLCIDEADTFVQGNEDMRGIINSGHT
jgi:hypothetical protein